MSSQASQSQPSSSSSNPNPNPNPNPNSNSSADNTDNNDHQPSTPRLVRAPVSTPTAPAASFRSLINSSSTSSPSPIRLPSSLLSPPSFLPSSSINVQFNSLAASRYARQHARAVTLLYDAKLRHVISSTAMDRLANLHPVANLTAFHMAAKPNLTQSEQKELDEEQKQGKGATNQQNHISSSSTSATSSRIVIPRPDYSHWQVEQLLQANDINLASLSSAASNCENVSTNSTSVATASQNNNSNTNPPSSIVSTAMAARAARAATPNNATPDNQNPSLQTTTSPFSPSSSSSSAAVAQPSGTAPTESNPSGTHETHLSRPRIGSMPAMAGNQRRVNRAEQVLHRNELRRQMLVRQRQRQQEQQQQQIRQYQYHQAALAQHSYYAGYAHAQQAALQHPHHPHPTQQSIYHNHHHPTNNNSNNNNNNNEHRPAFHLRHINVQSVAKFIGVIGGILSFMRLWIVMSLALAKTITAMAQIPTVEDAVARVAQQAITRVTDEHLYHWLVDVLSHEDPSFMLHQQVNFAGLHINPSVYLSAFLTLPIIEAGFCYIIGAAVAMLLNFALSVSNGIRIENRDE